MPNLMSMPFVLSMLTSMLFVNGLATLYLVDIVVYFVVAFLLCDVAMQPSNVMSDVVVLLGWLSMVVVDVCWLVLLGCFFSDSLLSMSLFHFPDVAFFLSMLVSTRFLMTILSCQVWVVMMMSISKLSICMFPKSLLDVLL